MEQIKKQWNRGMGGRFCVEISLGFDYDCGKEIFMEELMLQRKLEKSASA